jgi:hypothetical protein
MGEDTARDAAGRCRPCEIERKKLRDNPLPGFPVDFPCRHGGVGLNGRARTDEHRDMLRRAAISDEVADAAGVRSEVGGMIFPYRRPGGETVDQWRPDQPAPDGPKYVWPPNVAPALNVHPDMRDRVADPAVPLLIVEGTKQYLAAVTALAGQPIAAVGISGCQAWLHGGAPIADLAGVPWDGRAVTIALDADVRTKRNVWDGADGLARTAEAYGAASVRHLASPGTGKAGLDDVLARVAAGDRGAVLARLIGSAGKLPRRPPAGRNGAPVADRSRIGRGYENALTSEVAAVAAVADPPPDGAQLLDEAFTRLTGFVCFQRPEHATAATLYAALTHAAGRLQVAPRLRVKSPVKRCGKTRLLQALAPLTSGPLPTANISAAALVRCIAGQVPPTLVLDEMDAVFGKTAAGDEKAETLRGVLNAGFDRGAPYIRYNASTGEVEHFPTFALAIIAGIGDLPDTIEDRAVIIPMARKTADTRVWRFRVRRDIPALLDLGARLAAWIGPLAEAIGAAEPPMPPGLSDRAEDVWEPLVAVADAAGGRWPELARIAAVAMAAEAAGADADVSAVTRLLADMRTVLGDAHAMHGTVILAKLAGLEGSPWADWSYGRALNARQMADMLRPFGACPRDVKLPGDTSPRKGYYRADFRDAWTRYATVQGGAATAATAATAQVSDGLSSATDPRPIRDRTAPAPYLAPPPPNQPPPTPKRARPPAAPPVVPPETQAFIDGLVAEQEEKRRRGDAG